MSRTAIPPKRFVGQLGHVRTAHYHRNSHRANRVRDAISLRDHARHSPDPHQSDLVLAHVLRDLRLIHGLRIAVDQNHFVSGRGERLQKKHPQMRHEIAGDPVVGVIEQDFQ